MCSPRLKCSSIRVCNICRQDDQCRDAAAWKGLCIVKSGNIIAFPTADEQRSYRERFDEISKLVFDGLDGASQLSKLPIEALAACNVFAGVDAMLIRWMSERLESEDIDARLDGKTIPEICAARRKLHFGQAFKSRYFVIVICVPHTCFGAVFPRQRHQQSDKEIHRNGLCHRQAVSLFLSAS